MLEPPRSFQPSKLISTTGILVSNFCGSSSSSSSVHSLAVVVEELVIVVLADWVLLGDETHMANLLGRKRESTIYDWA